MRLGLGVVWLVVALGLAGGERVEEEDRCFFSFLGRSRREKRTRRERLERERETLDLFLPCIFDTSDLRPNPLLFRERESNAAAHPSFSPFARAALVSFSNPPAPFCFFSIDPLHSRPISDARQP